MRETVALSEISHFCGVFLSPQSRVVRGRTLCFFVLRSLYSSLFVYSVSALSYFVSLASTMSSPTQVLKSVGPKLVPFFKSVAVYFVLMAEQPSLITACFKCLPIISLIFFVLLNGISLSEEYTFSRRILTGLVFSCLGDAFLVWPTLFVPGMCMFAIAQITYIAAFGFKPLNKTLGATLYAFCSIVICILMPGLDGVLTIGVPVYTLLLTTMAWRAISRVQIFGELWTWTKLCSCLGSICFLISDTLLGIHHFHTPLPYSQVSIMLTYYAAQLGIALSAVDSKNNHKPVVVAN